MSAISIFNHVLGPIMRGPSSSHTAGAFHLGKMARALFGEAPARAEFACDPRGSYAKTFVEQGADRAFALGLLRWELTDERFFDALAAARDHGIKIDFQVRELENPEHPNTVELALTSAEGRALRLRANSIGGGAVVFTALEDWPVRLTGESHELLLETDGDGAAAQIALMNAGELLGDPTAQTHDGRTLILARRTSPPPNALRDDLEKLAGFRQLWACEPVYYVQRGAPLATSAAELAAAARERGATLGAIALQSEAALLGVTTDEALAEMCRRLDVMAEAVRRGLSDPPPALQLLEPSAKAVYDAEREGRVALGGLHTRAAARALAAMHVNSSMGVVCAAPTGGAAGVLPAVAVTLLEERGLTREDAARALFAAGAVGMVLATRATFAAEVAGCQVEIGAAGAMAAAMVVEAAGGSAEQALEAAAISFQNTMGSVCDLVQGMVEIPCHTRNAVAASNAFVCADLIMGGYRNPVPLDETIDAVYSVGKLLPPELRCTAAGGLALCPSAQNLKRRDNA